MLDISDPALLNCSRGCPPGAASDRHALRVGRPFELARVNAVAFGERPDQCVGGSDIGFQYCRGGAATCFNRQ